MVKLLLAAAARHITADLTFLDDTEAALMVDPETLASLRSVSAAQRAADAA